MTAWPTSSWATSAAGFLIGAFGDPKLTDFGIARLTGGPHTTSGLVTASVAHAPPEILGGQTPDVRADVYSLCSTMFTLVAGRTPFERDTDESLLPLIARIVGEAPPALSNDTPEALSAVLRRGLAKASPRPGPVISSPRSASRPAAASSTTSRAGQRSRSSRSPTWTAASSGWAWRS